jgi:hypothetical protein
VLLRRRLSLGIAAALVLVMMIFAAFGPVSDRGLAPRFAEAAPAVQVNVNCTSNPERTAVKNNTNSSIKVRTVGSIYQPRSNEPFLVNRTLKPRQTITFQSGSNANGSNALTTAYIYNNDVGSKEGARVSTSVGRFVDKC